MTNNDNLNTNWRKVAAAVYKKPSDAKILGSVEIDVTDIEEYINKKRKEGLRITLTHIFTLIIARALKEDVSELNVSVVRGKVIPRSSIEASVSVLLRDNQLSSVKVPDADKMTLKELADFLFQGIKESRKGSENKTMKMKGLLGSIPWPFRGWIFRFFKILTIDLGYSIPSLGLSSSSFGSFVISNIGSLGLEAGFPALFPVSNVSFVMILGGVDTRPWVVDGKIVPRRILWLGTAIDHRAADGFHGGKLFRYIREVLKDIEQLERKPSWCE
ncbi:MAG TPA: 2-oxo acid dehydrogenase subunit E2 [Bacteroidales bacterium]|nr:2-oxo acid dehydrogenase subunit E2 [Bacteroidales bacterium]